MAFFLSHPAGLWTAALVVALAVLHLLAPRWKRRVVPSLFLWRRIAARGLELRSRRPAADLPLVLGVLGASALALASAGPVLLRATASGRELVVVIDNGTSSLTEGVRGRTRLADAVAFAGAELASLGEGDAAAVVATSPSARVVEPLGSPGRAREALARIEPVQVSGALAEAVALALSQGTAGSEPPEVVVFTSRALPTGMPATRRVPVGREGRNLAIVDADFSDDQAFCALRNFSSREAVARVSLRVLDPAPPREIASIEARVPAGGRVPVVLAPAGGLEATLAAARAVELSHSWAEDDLWVDDRVWAAREAVSARRVGIVGEPPECLLRAIWAARAEAVVLAGGAGVPADVDCLVYLRELPAAWPPPACALLVSPPRSLGPIEILGEELLGAKGVFASGTDERSLVRGFPPVTVAVERSRRARIFAPHEVLLLAGGEVLAAALRGGHVYLGFAPDESDWPDRASFPVFVARFLEEAARHARAAEAARWARLAYARVGETPGALLGPAPPPLRTGSGRELPQGARPLAAGLYRARGDWLAVNLLSERESDNALAPDGHSGAGRSAPRGRRTAQTGLGGALAAAALALFLAEWLASAHRGQGH